MKVWELIAILSEMDGDREVILQKDAEGNGYSPLVGAESCIYKPHSTWSGDVLDDAEPRGDEQAAVVLWPVN